MKHRPSTLATLFAILSFTASQALANSFEFTVDGHEAVYQTPLPIGIYRYTHSNALADLTITNAAGEQVPHDLLTDEQLHPQTSIKYDKKSLPIYPLLANSLDNPDNLHIQLEKGGDKTIVEISSGQAKTNANTVYLLDAGEHAPALDTLAVEWQGADAQFVGLEVLASDDLKTWRNIGRGALLKTANGGNNLLQNTIKLDYPTTSRYLQIKPLEALAKDGFALTKATAIYSQLDDTPSPLHWQKLTALIREQGKKPSQININYEASGHYPASQLRISLPNPNTITTVTVATRNKTDANWEVVTSAVVYDMIKGGNRLINRNIDIAPRVAHYWQLQFDESNGGIGAGVPQLEVGWQPHTAVWNARGQTPFTLHVGENPTVVNRVSVSNLIPDYDPEKIRRLPFAPLSDKAWDTGLKSTTETGNSWETPPDYKRWWLWGGLVLGVLLLAGMAYSLLKTRSKKPT